MGGTRVTVDKAFLPCFLTTGLALAGDLATALGTLRTLFTGVTSFFSGVGTCLIATDPALATISFFTFSATTGSATLSSAVNWSGTKGGGGSADSAAGDDTADSLTSFCPWPPGEESKPNMTSDKTPANHQINRTRTRTAAPTIRGSGK